MRKREGERKKWDVGPTSLMHKGFLGIQYQPLFFLREK